MITIGIDASLTRTAIAALPARIYAIIPTQVGTPPHMRLRRIAEDVYDFVRPIYDAAAGEELVVSVETPGFMGDNVNTAYSLGRAQGAALSGLPPFPDIRTMIVTEAAWRSQLGIKRGLESKANVAAYLEARGIEVPVRLEGRRRIPDDDVADAYGLAVYGTLVGEQQAEIRKLAGIRRGRAR